MKTWTELQEWVEVNAQTHADLIYTTSQQAAQAAITKQLLNTMDRPFFLALTTEERDLISAALRWKATEKLAEFFTSAAEGWCESYYRDLKRMYEEES